MLVNHFSTRLCGLLSCTYYLVECNGHWGNLWCCTFMPFVCNVHLYTRPFILFVSFLVLWRPPPFLLFWLIDFHVRFGLLLVCPYLYYHYVSLLVCRCISLIAYHCLSLLVHVCHCMSSLVCLYFMSFVCLHLYVIVYLYSYAIVSLSFYVSTCMSLYDFACIDIVYLYL